jgi:hypothetical protein
MMFFTIDSSLLELHHQSLGYLVVGIQVRMRGERSLQGAGYHYQNQHPRNPAPA